MKADDLRGFWGAVRAELDAVPVGAETEPVEPPLDALVQVQRVTMSGLGGVRFRAYLCTPQLGAGAGPRPAVVCTPGYGGTTPHTSWWGLCYDRGFALLVVYPRGQGDSAELWRVPAGLSKLTMGLDDPAGQYYRAAYADCMRGIDFLCEHPGIDRERIGALGLSQGGGLTLATAALDGRVRAAVAHEPFLCNYPVAVETATTGPYLELTAWLREHPERREQALATLAWFDPVNLAQLIACPTFISIGLADTTCPPETIRPVYDAITAMKGLIEIPGAGHGWQYDYRPFNDLWLRRFLG